MRFFRKLFNLFRPAPVSNLTARTLPLPRTGSVDSHIRANLDRIRRIGEYLNWLHAAKARAANLALPTLAIADQIDAAVWEITHSTEEVVDLSEE